MGFSFVLICESNAKGCGNDKLELAAQATLVHKLERVRMSSSTDQKSLEKSLAKAGFPTGPFTLPTSPKLQLLLHSC